MKKIIIAIVGLLFFNSGFSKALKVKVISMGEPLAYSYISINGDVKTIADSLGFATLPMSWLNVGDTISASFVGYNAKVSIFDASIKEEGVIRLDLTADFTMEEVVVKIDIERLYKKHTRVGQFYHWGVTYDTKFNYTLKNEGEIVKKDSGNLYFTYPYKTEEGNWRNVIQAYAYPNSNVEKDSSFISKLIVSVHFPIAHDSRFYNYILRGKAYNKRTLGYRGIIDNCRVFTAITKTEEKTTQIICYFDKETKHLIRYCIERS